MVRRAVSLYEAYAAAPHGWTVSSSRSKRTDSTGIAETTAPSTPLNPQYLPDEILLQVIHYLARIDPGFDPIEESEQRDLHAFSLVNTQWNAIATPLLYHSPLLEGARYDLFTRTICPSINLNVRKSPLSSYVRKLDLTRLVHQGSKSVTARLLGRTKGTLLSFSAPQASFSLNCYPALSKCRALEKLDLSFVSDLSSLKSLFDAVTSLGSLTILKLPRSSGFGAVVDPATIKWPPRLEELGLSGGLQAQFWTGAFHFPEPLHTVSITHCPKVDNELILAFFDVLAGSNCNLRSLRFAHLPMLGPSDLDCVLDYFPLLHSLSVSIDYVTPELLNPSIPRDDVDAADFLSDDEQYSPGPDEDELFDGDGPPSMRRGGDKKRCHSYLKLESLHLSNSGERDPTGKIEPLDVLMYADDYGMVPRLEMVAVSRALGWEGSADLEEQSDALHDWLIDNAEERGHADRTVGLYIWD